MDDNEEKRTQRKTHGSDWYAPHWEVPLQMPMMSWAKSSSIGKDHGENFNTDVLFLTIVRCHSFYTESTRSSRWEMLDEEVETAKTRPISLTSSQMPLLNSSMRDSVSLIIASDMVWNRVSHLQRQASHERRQVCGVLSRRTLSFILCTRLLMATGIRNDTRLTLPWEPKHLILYCTNQTENSWTLDESYFTKQTTPETESRRKQWKTLKREVLVEESQPHVECFPGVNTFLWSREAEKIPQCEHIWSDSAIARSSGFSMN